MSQQIVTANLLRGGNVVFLAADGSWSPRIELARVAENDEQAQELEALARASEETTEEATQVVGPYLIEVEGGKDGLRPTKYREWIRTKGPSVRQDLGYQSSAAQGAGRVRRVR